MKFLDDFEMNLTTEESVSKLRSQEIYNNFLQVLESPGLFSNQIPGNCKAVGDLAERYRAG